LYDEWKLDSLEITILPINHIGTNLCMSLMYDTDDAAVAIASIASAQSYPQRLDYLVDNVLARPAIFRIRVKKQPLSTSWLSTNTDIYPGSVKTYGETFPPSTLVVNLCFKYFFTLRSRRNG